MIAFAAEADDPPVGKRPRDFSDSDQTRNELLGNPRYEIPAPGNNAESEVQLTAKCQPGQGVPGRPCSGPPGVRWRDKARGASEVNVDPQGADARVPLGD